MDQGRRRGGGDVEFTALLVPEPTNPYDENAIRVDAEGVGTVGYFSREDAIQYAPLRDLLVKEGSAGVCEASLIGGWEDENGRLVYLGVQILIPDPPAFGPAPEFEAYRGAPAPPPFSTPEGWDSMPRMPIRGTKVKPVNIVDEWYFREEQQIDEGRAAQGETVTFTAIMIPAETGVSSEPVRLVVCRDGGGVVGRISASVIKRYESMITDLRDARSVGVCDAWLFAEKSGNLGVKLMLPPPAKAVLEAAAFDEEF